MMARDVSLDSSLLKKRKEKCCASPLDGGRVEPQSITNQALLPCALSLIFALNGIAPSRTDGAP
ncbi:hypothetical protein WME73_11215 [Sorangium sp. So ce302]|uniref:hypothetical protein n=1 Tax=Sorangium sp. So ce302 TaxID=3133297 RepID=UPI003F5F2000